MGAQGLKSVVDDSLFACCDHNILCRAKYLFQFVVAKTSSHTDSEALTSLTDYLSLFTFGLAHHLLDAGAKILEHDHRCVSSRHPGNPAAGSRAGSCLI